MLPPMPQAAGYSGKSQIDDKNRQSDLFMKLLNRESSRDAKKSRLNQETQIS